MASHDSTRFYVNDFCMRDMIFKKSNNVNYETRSFFNIDLADLYNA